MKQKKLTLREQRKNVQDAIKRAISRNDFAEVERLEGNLEYLEKQIRRK